MKIFTEQELKEILRKHKLWLEDSDQQDAERADLSCAYLSDANLSGANLSGANLSGANLSGAKNIPFIPYACPDFGAFIGYKKAQGLIVELEILSDAKRVSATGRKCRCDKAKVLSIQSIDGTPSILTSVASDRDSKFIYKVGEIVSMVFVRFVV